MDVGLVFTAHVQFGDKLIKVIFKQHKIHLRFNLYFRVDYDS